MMQDVKAIAEKISAQCGSLEVQREQLAAIKGEGWTHGTVSLSPFAAKQLACTQALATYRDGRFELRITGVLPKPLSLTSADEVLKFVKDVEEELGLGEGKG